MPLKKPSTKKAKAPLPVEEAPTTTTAAVVEVQPVKGPLVESAHYQRLEALDLQLDAMAGAEIVAYTQHGAKSSKKQMNSDFTALVKSELVQSDPQVQQLLAKHRRWNMKMRMASGNENEEDEEGDGEGDADDDDDSASFSSDDDDPLFGDYLLEGDEHDDTTEGGVQQGGGAILNGKQQATTGAAHHGDPTSGGASSNFAQNFVRRTYKEARRSQGWSSGLNQPYLVHSTKGGTANTAAATSSSSVVFDSRIPSSTLAGLGGATQSALPESNSIRNYEKRVARMLARERSSGLSGGGADASFLSKLGVGAQSSTGGAETEADRVLADFEFAEKLRSRSQRKRELKQGGPGGRGATSGFLGLGAMTANGGAVAGGAGGGVNEQNRHYNQRLAASYSLKK